MDWLVARHGHTFGPDQLGGEKVILCGSGQNIPLVARGRDKARAFAEYLWHQDLVPTALYANHLLRTWEHACLIRETLRQKTQTEVPIYLVHTPQYLTKSFIVYIFKHAVGTLKKVVSRLYIV